MYKTGGLWYGQEKQKAGLAQSQKCPDCGAEKDSLEHKMNECPAYSELRSKGGEVVRYIHEKTLPRCMRVHGIMPPLLARTDPKFWYEREHKSGKVPEPGMPVHRTIRDRERQELTEVVAAERGETPEYVNFEQSAVPISEGPRAQLYTDGTVDLPQRQEYAIGGAAVWRSEEQEGAEAGRKRDEAAIKRIIIENGTAWLAAVLGRVQSSTRAEILAGLLAAVGEKPLDIYTDSKCFISMHRQACARLAGKRQPPFARQKMGTLLEHGMRCCGKGDPGR